MEEDKEYMNAIKAEQNLEYSEMLLREWEKSQESELRTRIIAELKKEILYLKEITGKLP